MRYPTEVAYLHIMNMRGKILFVALLALAVIFIAFLAAKGISENDAAKDLVARFGVFGIVITAFVAGLNLFVPVHAATFAPVFLSAGFSMLIIMILLIQIMYLIWQLAWIN